jgi:hypothetical protein
VIHFFDSYSGFHHVTFPPLRGTSSKLGDTDVFFSSILRKNRNHNTLNAWLVPDTFALAVQNRNCFSAPIKTEIVKDLC